MNIKLPACYDVSDYQFIENWNNVSPRPLLVICKATEGNYRKDSEFNANMDGLANAGIRRGCYHFHRKAIAANLQADYFIAFVRPKLSANDFIVLDIEEGGETAAQIIAWLDRVEAAFSNEILLYSRKNILDPISALLDSLGFHSVRWDAKTTLDVMEITPAQITRLKKYKTWVAGYPSQPDAYNTIPSSYIPDQTKWGKPVLWQYYDKGVIKGITSSSVDLNWIEPTFAANLGIQPNPADSDMVTTPRPGMIYISGIRKTWDFKLFKLDPTLYDFEVVVCIPPETPMSVAKRKGAILAFPAGDYDRFTYAIQDYTVSNSIIFQERVAGGGRPSFMVLQDGKVIIDQRAASGVEQAFTGIRPLITNGIIDLKLSDMTQAQNTEGHARFMYGLDAKGNVMLMVSEGIHPTQTLFDGLTLLEGAQVQQEYGAITTADGGGGGDVTVVYQGEQLITPENMTPDGNHFERPLPVVLCVYERNNPMYGQAKEAQGNTTTVRDKPSRYGVSMYSKPAYGIIDFASHADVVISGPMDAPSDKWLKLPDGNYVNHILAGKTYYTILSEPSTDPVPQPSTDEILITEINLTAKTVTVKLPNSDWKGTIQ